MRYLQYLALGILYKSNKKILEQKNDTTVSYDGALRIGYSIGKLLTNIWNSQKNPDKAYVFKRRFYHGEVGILIGLCNLIKESRPATTGVFSGLGQAVVQDDIGDKDEWFGFKINDSNKANSETPTEVERK